MLEREHHVELVALRVGDVAGELDRAAGHLPDREQSSLLEPDLTVHLGEELVQSRAVGDGPLPRDVAMSLERHAVGQRRVLGDQVDDVHPEAVDTPVDPPAHHRVDGLADLFVLPVQIGLLAREDVQVVLATAVVVLPGGAGENRLPVVGLGAVARRPPPVPVPLGRVRVARLLEPRVLVRGVVDHEVHHDLDVAVVGRGDHLVEVCERAEQPVDVLVVADVVAVVVHRGGVDRRQPQHVDAEPLQVVQARRYAGDVAHTVAVAVRERAWVDLIDDGALPPVRGARLGCLRSHVSTLPPGPRTSTAGWVESERVAT